ncbi:hypothetical protein [Streptomyces sp. x-80]
MSETIAGVRIPGSAVSDERCAAVVAAHPRPDFENRILAARSTCRP